MARKITKTAAPKPSQVYVSLDSRLPRRTPSVAFAEVLASITRTMQDDAERNDQAIKKFAANLATGNDPARAFEWSSDEFQHAARYRAAQIVLAWIEQSMQAGDEYSALSAEKIVITTRDRLLDEVIRGARYPQRSTSVPSNEIAARVLAQQAEYLDKFNRSIEFNSGKYASVILGMVP